MLTLGYHLNTDFIWEAHLDCHFNPALPTHVQPSVFVPNIPLSPTNMRAVICSHHDVNILSNIILNILL